MKENQAQSNFSAGRFAASVFGISFINAVFLFVGAIVLVLLFGLGNQGLFLNSFFLAVFSVLLTLVTGIAYDLQPGPPGSLT